MNRDVTLVLEAHSHSSGARKPGSGVSRNMKPFIYTYHILNSTLDEFLPL